MYLSTNISLCVDIHRWRLLYKHIMNDNVVKHTNIKYNC